LRLLRADIINFRTMLVIDRTPPLGNSFVLSELSDGGEVELR